jgi:hypothetical protein
LIIDLTDVFEELDNMTFVSILLTTTGHHLNKCMNARDQHLFYLSQVWEVFWNIAWVKVVGSRPEFWLSCPPSILFSSMNGISTIAGSTDTIA